MRSLEPRRPMAVRMPAMGHRVHQRGQVLVFGLALMVLGAGGLYWLFDVGQVLSAKTKLVNAADSAAYSAAGWRARVFNYMAYSNRAIIAQEVSIAQAITLDSWSQYFEGLTGHLDTLAQAHPGTAALGQVLDGAAQAARLAAQTAATTEVALRDAPEVGYKSLLQHSQRVMAVAGNTFGASAVANEVAKATDARIFAFALPNNQEQYKPFVKQYATHAERQRLKQLVVDSLDGFTGGPRNESQLLVLMPSLCFGSSTRWRDWFHSFEKRGATLMTPDLERWEAADTASLHNVRRKWFSTRCRRRESMRLGWGAAELTSQVPARALVSDPGGTFQTNPAASAMAQQALAQPVSRAYAGTGIGRVHDLDYQALGANAKFPASRVTVLAQMPAQRLRVSAALTAASGRLKKSGSYARGRLFAVSAAQVYFSRPPSAAHRVEYASLYNPYWQAKLVPLTPAEQQEANSRAN